MKEYIELNGPSDKELEAVKEPNKDELLNLKKLFNLDGADNDLDEDYRLQEEVNDLMLADIEVQDPVDLW